MVTSPLITIYVLIIKSGHYETWRFPSLLAWPLVIQMFFLFDFRFLHLSLTWPVIISHTQFIDRVWWNHHKKIKYCPCASKCTHITISVWIHGHLEEKQQNNKQRMIHVTAAAWPRRKEAKHNKNEASYTKLNWILTTTTRQRTNTK